MHRLFTPTTVENVVDHINRKKLDNRRGNLRICSAQENSANKPAQENNVCGYRGVCQNIDKRWIAQINKDGQATFLGSYNTAEEAANAYDSAAAVLYGEYAWRNIPGMPLRTNIFAELESIRRSKWLTDDEIALIWSMRDAGRTTRDIAAAIGRSKDTVYHVLRQKTYQNDRHRPSRATKPRKAVRKHHSRWLPGEKAQDIYDFLKAGYPNVDVAWAVGCSISTVQRHKTAMREQQKVALI